MSKMVIVEGNSSDKDNVRNYMVKGEKGDSAYDIAVKNGYEGTEAEWLDQFVNAENYYNKTEVDESQETQDTIIAQKTYYFDTVEDMKEYDLVEGDFARTLGYYTVNDGGGAEYQIVNNSALVEDGGTVISLTNEIKAVLVIHDDSINVKQFGCKGDGTTNDDTHFNNAINSNYDIFVPEGTYLIENITLKNRQKLTGENMTKTILKSIDNNSNDEIITVGNNNGVYNVVSNLSIDGNKNNQTTEIDGINLTNTSDSHHYLQMLQIYNCSGNGIYANGQKELKIENCVVRGCKMHGIYLYSSSDNSIISTTVYNCLLNGFRTNAGMNRFTNCKAFSNGRVTDVAIDTNYTERYAGFYDSRGNNYVNCDAQGNYGHGFEFINTNDLSCIGVRTNLNGIQVNSSNEIISFTETPFYDGIHLDHCRYSTIITTALSMYSDDKKCQRYALCIVNDNGNSDYLYANINHTNQLSGGINTLPDSVVHYNIIDNGNNINPISDVNYTLNTTGGFEENTYLPLKIEKTGRTITLNGLVHNTSSLVSGTTYKVLTITSSSNYFADRNIPIQVTIRSSQTGLPEGLCYGIINTSGQLQIKVPTITNGQYIELHGNWFI